MKDRIRRSIPYRRTVIVRASAFILALLLSAMPVLGTMAENDTTAVKKSNYVISDLAKARTALEKLAGERQIPALVYLKDAYTIRTSADAYSDRVATVASGQLVYIISVDADGGRNIWYKVNFMGDGVSYTGYVERDFLACSDERLLSWETKYVTTVKREATASKTYCADIEAFPESYKDALYELKAAHPEWIFVKMDTGLDFAATVAAEGQGSYSLIWTKSCLSSWIEAKYDSNWSYATDGIIAYYMDPRNFLTETQIFQFEQQTYNPSYHTQASIQKILEGTFMAGNIEGTNVSYASNFLSLGSKYNISPVLQAARVRQEQGNDGTSPLISGTYPGFEGFYNYYNVGASSADPIVDGLKFARDKVWNSRQKSLEGGVQFLGGSYISHGQDTLYLQKFDVDASQDGVLKHQYMQNIVAPSNESDMAYKGYKAAGLINGTPFVFRIPVYKNMPSGKSKKPDTKDVLTVNMSKVENLPVDQSAVLIPYINGGVSEAYDYTYTSSNKGVAKVDGNGVITGVKPGSANITCTAGTAGSVVCKVSVIKADIALSDVKKPALSVTYSPSQTLADIELPKGFAWADTSITPVVNNQGYTAIYSPDMGRYNNLTLTLDVAVTKAQIDRSGVETPSGITATAGTELSSVALPNHYSWENVNSTVASKAGKYTYKASYCSDPDNYETLTGIDIPVTVVCAEHKFSDWSEPENGYIYRKCSVCGTKESLKVDDQVTEKDCTTLGHDIVDGVCTRCGYEEPTIQEHKHEYSISSNTATCTEAGEITYTCSCGDSYTEASQALGHHMAGNKCDRCGYVYVPTAAVTPLPATDGSASPTKASGAASSPEASPTKASDPGSAVTPVSDPSPTPEPTPTETPAPTEEPTPTPEPTPEPTVQPAAAPAAGSAKQPKIEPQITQIASDSGKTENKTSAASEQKPTDRAEADTSDTGKKEETGYKEIDIPVATEETSSSQAEPADIVIDAGEGASWTISGSEATEEQLAAIDMSVTFGEADIPANTLASLRTNDFILMSIAHDGEFGFDAVLTVDTGEGHIGEYANLYYYDPTDEKLDLIDSVKIDGSGNAGFKLKHASDYVITFSDKQMIAKNSTNTMLFIILGVILAGGVGVLAFVLVGINRTGREDDSYFDLDDDR